MGTKLLCEKVSEGWTLRILLSEDSLSCAAVLLPGAVPSESLPPAVVLEALASCGVTAGVDEGAVAALGGSLPGGTAPEGIVVARAIPPTPPREGAVEFAVRPDTGVASYAVKADGSVDFHNRLPYDNVAEGQPVGVYHPPAEGKPGMTVTGQKIPPVRLSAAPVTFGRGVRLDPGDGKITATAAGRVVFVRNAVSVEEEYAVKGDVDFEIGNIRVPGFVIVGGDVIDNFSVTGGKGIKVAGTVGAASLQSDGDIVLSGVSGKGKGKIVCGGTLRAKFLSEVDVECRGNVVVESEIRGSSVKSGGTILVSNGTIAGGECVALGGIEVRVAGSVMGVRTALVAGIDYRHRGRMNILKGKLRIIDGEIRKIEAAIGSIAPGDAEFDALPPSRKEAVSKQAEKLASLRRDREAVAEEAGGIHPENNPAANPMINIRGKLMEGTSIALGNASVQILEEVQGPVSVIENTRDGTLRFLPPHQLAIRARDIEAAILREEDARKAPRG